MASGYNSRCLVGLAVLALISFSPPAPAEAISCTQALEFLMPCQSYLLGLAGIGSSCCLGAQSLARAAVSPTDRKSVCQCLKQVAMTAKVDEDKAKQLPQLCNIDVPVPVQFNVNCDAIPVNDVSFRSMNRYKNLEENRPKHINYSQSAATLGLRMKPFDIDYFGGAEDPTGGVPAAMDVDDVGSSLRLFSEGPFSVDSHRFADSDFFNSLEDDFDDEDIN
ncbi:Non-specific lipid-transfer protein 2A [Sesamum alatum]|uniref:Non-specific lipid-transfer protein n=1 Tax=Sesamum alatum TaxID=300844 RepID=A0AAE1YZY7_9LAMI|nr:Non-specific lipid-transfer protein 2A [Sesamum alatum]